MENEISGTPVSSEDVRVVVAVASQRT